MDTKKKIKVYVKYNDKDIKCMCLVSNPLCKEYNNCNKDIVTLDKFQGWQQCFNQNRYGK